MKYGKIYTYENRNEAEIGKMYVFNDFCKSLCESPEIKPHTKLKAVSNNGCPFETECGISFQFIREVIDENNTLMTYRQLAEWLAKGNGQSKDEGSWLYSYLAYEPTLENELVHDTVRIRLWGSDEWVVPTVDIYERDCR